MKVQINTIDMTVVVESEPTPIVHSLYSPEAFSILAELWVKVGWQLKYPYLFTWFGRPVIQLPEDILTIQEVVYTVKPDVIIETGVAHGGSLVFYATLCEVLGRGRVIGIDIEIRPHNRSAIEAHELFHRITLIEGSSTDEAVVDRVKKEIDPGDSVLVILDSNHTKPHVLAELKAYSGLVTPGSYIVATDGVMEMLYDVPRGAPSWQTDNPKAAVTEFLRGHSDFVLEDPPRPMFDESLGASRATHWPSAYLRRR